MDEEGLRETANKMIFIGRTIEMDEKWLMEKLGELAELGDCDDQRVKELVHEIVPTYREEEKK